MALIAKALTHYLNQRKNTQTLRILSHLPETFEQLNFASNDYLNLSQHPDIIHALQSTASSGLGKRSARLVLSTQHPYESLESKIALAYQQEKALLFSSGFQANATLMRALLDSRVLKQAPLLFCDRLMHASFHFGCHGTKQLRYPHNDLDYLESLLKKHETSHQPKFIVTESLFGMDGDMADISKLITLKEKYNAFLIVDESHALGCYGEKGYGLTENVAGKIDIITSSLNKGIGVMGGFVACSELIYDFLINHCAGLIYTNALPYPLIEALKTAWDLLPTLQDKRMHLHSLSEYAKKSLLEIGCHLGRTESHLLPIIVGNNKTTLNLKTELLKQNIWVGAIRPPTVPAAQARLRICLNAQHTQNDINQLTKVLFSLINLA